MQRAFGAVVRAVGLFIGLSVSLACACAGIAAAAELQTPVDHVRTADQTFLTFPEWYLVHSPAEYAGYLEGKGQVSAFPLFSHIGQFWQSYAAVNREIARYPFNGGYQLMVIVIGVSTTLEYGLKGLYEHTLGRLAEATRSGAAVPEEQFAARYARSYVDFIRVDPWYLYDFWSRLRELWQSVPIRGPDLVRRWERRFALSTELLVKAGYARLIKLGSESIYDAPKPVTAVVVSRAPEPDPAGHAEFHVLSGGADGSPVVATLPRYAAFSDYSQWLARQGIDFHEIAGNQGEILISVLVSGDASSSAGRLVFEQPILTQPGRRRLVVAIAVAQLTAELRGAQQSQGRIALEHVYDY